MSGAERSLSLPLSHSLSRRPLSQTVFVRNIVACGLWLSGESELARVQINALAHVYAERPWCYFGPGWARTLVEAAREVGAVLTG